MPIFKMPTYVYFNNYRSTPTITLGDPSSQVYVVQATPTKGNILSIGSITEITMLKDILGATDQHVPNELAMESALHVSHVDLGALSRRFVYWLVSNKVITNVGQTPRYYGLATVQRMQNHLTIYIFIVGVRRANQRYLIDLPRSALYAIEFKDSKQDSDMEVLIHMPRSLHGYVTNIINKKQPMTIKLNIDNLVNDQITIDHQAMHNARVLFMNNLFSSLTPYLIAARLPYASKRMEICDLATSAIGSVLNLKGSRFPKGKNIKLEMIMTSDIFSNSKRGSKLDIVPSVLLRNVKGIALEIEDRDLYENLKREFRKLFIASLNYIANNSDIISDIVQDMVHPSSGIKLNLLKYDQQSLPKFPPDTTQPTTFWNGVDPKALAKVLAYPRVFLPSTWKELITPVNIDLDSSLGQLLYDLFGNELTFQGLKVVLGKYINIIQWAKHNAFGVTILYALLRDAVRSGNLPSHPYGNAGLIATAFLLAQILKGGMKDIFKKGSKKKTKNKEIKEKIFEKISWLARVSTIAAIELGMHGIAHALVGLCAEPQASSFDIVITKGLGNEWSDGGIVRLNTTSKYYAMVFFQDQEKVNNVSKNDVVRFIQDTIDRCYKAHEDRVAKIRRAAPTFQGDAQRVNDLLEDMFVSVNEDPERGFSLPFNEARDLLEEVLARNNISLPSYQKQMLLEMHVPLHFDGCKTCILENAYCAVPSPFQRPWRISLWWAKYILENADVQIRTI